MKKETKIYSDFIKSNRIVSTFDTIAYYNTEGKLIVKNLTKLNNGKWVVEDEDSCFTKKAAIYFHIKNQSKINQPKKY